MTFLRYWPLLLLLLIPYIWWVQRQSRVALSTRHLRVSGLVRSAIVVLLSLALAQPVVYRPGERISVIYLLDVSQSVLPQDLQSAIRWIQQTNEAGNPDRARYMAFGANTAEFDTLDQLQAVRVTESAGPGTIGQNATNLEAALENALQNFAPHHLKRLVLMTDGNENNGRATSVISRLKSEGVQVYAMPLQARTDGDMWVESIMTPPEVASEEQFPLEVHVYSQIHSSAEVQLRGGEKRLGNREVELVPGLNRVAFETSVNDESRSVILEAEVKSSNDSFPGNNKFRQSIVLNGLPKILYVEGHRESARYLAAALGMEGFAVTILDPHALPATAAELDAYDALILSDVARSSLDERQMRAIATYVQELGGGFILAGGETSYGGDDGYSKTDVENILPITFDSKRPHRSVAMIVALDKSGSMGGPDFAFTKEAAKAPLQFLANSDTFGVVAFDSTFFWAVPFQRAENRMQMAQSINKIAAGGETDIYPALEAAYTQLARDTSEVKHVILLSDGHTARDPFQMLVEKMVEARITVSTIAVSTGADKALLAHIADWGKGRGYYLADQSHVPQVFTDETELAIGTTLREGRFTPLVKKSVQIFKGIDFKGAPPLLGYVVTKAKDKSQVLLESNRGDPILAHWQYGLGKTAAFMSDLKDRWAVDWLHWRGYSKFWSQLVRETMRTHDDSELDLRVIRDGDQAKITIDAVQKSGRFRNRLRSAVRVVRPDQSVSDVAVHQIGPGSYEAEFPLTQKGSYVLHLIGENGGLSRTLAYSYPEEYHFYPPNTDLLRKLSDETMGRFQPTAQQIFATRGESTRFPTPIWAYLAVVALLLYIGDVFLRRVRLFD